MPCIIYIVSPESSALVSDRFVLTVHNWRDPGSNLIQAKIIHCVASYRPSLAFRSTKVVQNNMNVIVILVRGLDRPTVHAPPPPPQKLHSLVYFCAVVSWIRQQQNNRQNIGIHFVLTTFFHRYPQLTFSSGGNCSR